MQLESTVPTAAMPGCTLLHLLPALMGNMHANSPASNITTPCIFCYKLCRP